MTDVKWERRPGDDSQKLTVQRHRDGASLYIEIYFDPTKLSTGQLLDEAMLLAHDVEDAIYDENG